MLPGCCPFSTNSIISRQCWKTYTGCLLSRELNSKCCCSLIKLSMIKSLYTSPICCLYYTPNKPLQSETKHLLRVPRCCLEGFGRCCFAYATPSLWNPFPTHVKHASSIDAFKGSLKTCTSILFVTCLVFCTYKPLFKCNIMIINIIKRAYTVKTLVPFVPFMFVKYRLCFKLSPFSKAFGKLSQVAVVHFSCNVGCVTLPGYHGCFTWYYVFHCYT